MSANEQSAPQDQALPGAVSEERWNVAQAWELEFWNRQNVPSPIWKRLLRPLAVLVGLRERNVPVTHDDRNFWWKRQFEGYEALPQDLKNVCELGCGPYTNVRLLGEGRTIEHVHCSDPLASHYVKYRYGWLGVNARAGRVSVDFHPAESCPYATGYFDVTIMINVLDHVRDARRCLEEAIRITRTGGHLVFGQDLTGAHDDVPSNPGHPFVLNHHQLLPVLDTGCERVLTKIVGREEVSEPTMHYGALAYIGRRKG